MSVDIGPKIGIDGEAEFRKELGNINQQLRTLGSEMKAVTSAFAGNEKSQEALSAQAGVLTRQIEAQEQKLSRLEKGLASAAQKYGENEDPQRVCAIGAVYGTWSNAGSFTPDDTETAWDADSLTEYLGSDALRGKDMLLALDGEDSPYLTENCLLKDTDIPVAEQVQKLFVLDKNNMASPESAESE